VHFLNLSARLWRDEHGLTWLDNAPLIQLLPDSTAREPYPLDWEEQRRLFQVLPDHLARMCLFKVNTGCREQDVCGLRWEWEVQVPELQSSVFIILGARVKNREDRLVVMNRIARSVIEEARGKHPDFVFTYRGHRVQSINNNGWQCARRSVGLTQVRVHDLKHTYGRRLRAAGVPLETRRVLLWHKNGDITTHYSAPELQELIEATERVCGQNFGKTSAVTLLKKKAVNGLAR
jgi:integrase